MSNGSIASHSEKDLALKLLSSLHLNVEEREALLHGHVRFSVAVAAISDYLSRNGWFPRQLPPDGIIGDKAIIEQKKDAIWLHQQFETGIGSFSPIQSKKVRNLKKAVRLYINHYGGSQIDGVDIYG